MIYSDVLIAQRAEFWWEFQFWWKKIAQIEIWKKKHKIKQSNLFDKFIWCKLVSIFYRFYFFDELLIVLRKFHDSCCKMFSVRIVSQKNCCTFISHRLEFLFQRYRIDRYRFFWVSKRWKSQIYCISILKSSEQFSLKWLCVIRLDNN